MLARAGPTGDPIATPSICLQNLLLNIKKNDSLVATFNKLGKTSLGIFWVFSFSLYKPSIQISMVSSSGMLVNNKSTFILATYKLGSYLQIFSPKLNESVIHFQLKVSKMVVKNLLVCG